jgi:hypothetical protein
MDRQGAEGGVMPYYGSVEELYYGYGTFTVGRQGISLIRVDMVNVCMRIKFRITWKQGSFPSGGGDCYATLGGIESCYALMPEYIYPADSFVCEQYDQEKHDLYPNVCNDVIHHLPQACFGTGNGGEYGCKTRINGDGEMWGELTAYRMKLASRPILRIFCEGDNKFHAGCGDSEGGAGGRKTGTQSYLMHGGETVLPCDIDLGAYLLYEGRRPDTELKQEYMLDITVDRNTISITEIGMADWDDGGNL